MTKVAIVGNTSRNVGAACAADLAFSGHEVRYLVCPGTVLDTEALSESGGFDVTGSPDVFFSRRTGKASLHTITRDPQAALGGAEVIVIDVEMPELETRFAALIEHLPKDALVYVQSFGYWVAARLRPLLGAAGREDVRICEAAIPTHHASLSGSTLTGNVLRKNVEIATIPAKHGEQAVARLRTLFPDIVAAPSVLQTSLESVNLMVHPAMALLGIGVMEKLHANGERMRFYRDCNVPSAGVLAEALDAERGRVCAAYGVRHRTLPQAIDHYYGTQGEMVYDAVKNCLAYQEGFGSAPADRWQDWESVDVVYAIVPLVRLAEQANIATPLHRSVAEVLGAVLSIDPWAASPSLDTMNLAGVPAEIAAKYGRGGA